MYTNPGVDFGLILRFAWRYLLFYFFYSAGIVVLHRFHVPLSIPFIPIGLIGTAVAFYVGFKNNSSYERLWEGRRIWGSLVNASRTWAIAVLDYVQAGPAVHRELIYRHLAYLTALRVQLRRVSVWQTHRDTAYRVVDGIDAFRQLPLEEELSVFLPPEEVAEVAGKANPAVHILRRQSHELSRLYDGGQISKLDQVELMRLLQELYGQQGACERLKTFPFPRQYAFFSKVFVWILVLLLPMGLIHEFTKIGDGWVWLTVPFHMLICWVFVTMEMVGDSSENPFENAINDVPMTAICRSVEIDLRQLLGEADVPPRIQPIDHILM